MRLTLNAQQGVVNSSVQSADDPLPNKLRHLLQAHRLNRPSHPNHHRNKVTVLLPSVVVDP